MTTSTATPEAAQKDLLIEALREHALKIKSVRLSNGSTSSYYVDLKQALYLPEPARLVGGFTAKYAHEVAATAVGGMAMGAMPLISAAILSEEGRDLAGFFVRKDRKEHGLERWIEGPDARLQARPRCLVVDDVVTTGTSTINAIDRVRDEGLTVVGVLSVVDRLAGGSEAIARAVDAPYRTLVSIDELYPERPDREG